VEANTLRQPSLEVTEEEFDLCFNVNVKGIYMGVNAILPQLLKNQNGGSIINMASIGAQRPRPGLTWYNSSKAAVTNVILIHGLYQDAANSLFSRPR
jgi:NAD(P)-dependent dehydrogenase (short-subunit alcohol dehydrogenase family)